jgi:hypothetical protein
MNKFQTLVLASTIALSLAGCAPLVESPVIDETASVSTEITSQPETESSDASTDDLETAPPEVESDPEPAGSVSETERLLVYLIEEEKLAHDVYTVLYEQYGSKVFGNILESETTHQDQVMALLDVYGVDDPRSSELGVFNDPVLQKLYDQLIELGSKSPADAYQVGVMIEEKDIADISTQLATATNQDVIDVLERLRSGSENHLRAFNRQL